MSQQQVRTWPHAGLCQLGHFLQACHLPPWSCSASLPGACQCEAHRELPPRLKDVSGATRHLTCSREAESETAAAAGEPKGLAQPCSAPPRHPLFPSQPALGSPSKGASLFGHVWPHQDLRELPVDRIPVFTAPELREGGTTAFLALISGCLSGGLRSPDQGKPTRTLPFIKAESPDEELPWWLSW